MKTGQWCTAVFAPGDNSPLTMAAAVVQDTTQSIRRSSGASLHTTTK